MGNTIIKRTLEDEWTEIPISMTITTGSAPTELKVYKNGSLRKIVIKEANRAAVTSAGQNAWGARVTGNVGNFDIANASSYYDSSGIQVFATSVSDAEFTINARVIGASLPTNAKWYCSFITAVV